MQTNQTGQSKSTPFSARKIYEKTYFVFYNFFKAVSYKKKAGNADTEAFLLMSLLIAMDILIIYYFTSSFFSLVYTVDIALIIFILSFGFTLTYNYLTLEKGAIYIKLEKKYRNRSISLFFISLVVIWTLITSVLFYKCLTWG